MRRSRGQIIPLVAISMTALMGFSGMAVDNGFWQYQQRQQQNAVDSAAMGGAQALALAGCGNYTAAQTAAYNDASSNGYTSGGNNTVTVSNPPTTGPYANNNCAVQVTIKHTNYATFFTRVLGRTSMTESTTATAQLVQDGNTTGVFTGPGTTTFGQPVSGPVTVSSSGSYSCGSVSVNLQGISYNGPGGGSAACSKASFPSASPVPGVPPKNPCPEIAGCTGIANNPPPITNCQSMSNQNMNPTISPGCYNNISVGSCGTVTLLPGTYVLNGTSDFSNSDFVGNGVTFYVTANGTAPDFSAARSATMSAPTSGNYKGVLYYQVASNTGTPSFSGSQVHWQGLLYAPSANNVPVTINNDYTVMVVGSANFTGSASTFASPSPGSSLISNVVLGQ